MKIMSFFTRIRMELALRMWSLEEVFQRGYSKEYRLFRLREALGLLNEGE
jgi:hypothetical protein